MQMLGWGMSETIKTIADLIPAPRNANQGTPRGRGMIEQSVRQRGAGRSGLAAKDGTMIAGSQTLDVMSELGIPVRTIHTTGEEWVVVVRDDLEPDSEEAELLGLDDNRAAELGLNYDPTILSEMAEQYDLSGLFFDHELDAILSAIPTADDWAGALGGLPDGDRAPFQQMTFTLSDEQAEQVKRALEKAKRVSPFIDTGNENGNGNALARVCEVFLG
jgi:hypothetical protein